jgi:mono/diheme cytochrome c family protein
VVLAAILFMLGFVFVRDESVTFNQVSPAELHRQGKAEFDRHCRACHSETELAKYLARQSEEKARSSLIQFLARHGASSDHADKLIVDYLLAVRE